MLAALNALASQLLTLAPYLIVGLVVEACLKADRRPERNMLFNVGCMVLFWACQVALGGVLAIYTTRIVTSLPGSGMLAWWPATSFPPLAGILVWMAVNDFFYYWWHRLQHTSSWLWAQHELHHSDEQMNVTTTYRHHWLEHQFQALFVVAPVAYLFKVPVGYVLLAQILTYGQGFFIHVNASIGGGWWTAIVATPNSHRIHHSKLPEHRDKNFAAYFPFWDVVFGTYVAPRSGICPPVGLASGDTVHTFGRAFFLPFLRWRDMITRKDGYT